MRLLPIAQVRLAAVSLIAIFAIFLSGIDPLWGGQTAKALESATTYYDSVTVNKSGTSISFSFSGLKQANEYATATATFVRVCLFEAGGVSNCLDDNRIYANNGAVQELTYTNTLVENYTQFRIQGYNDQDGFSVLIPETNIVNGTYPTPTVVEWNLRTASSYAIVLNNYYGLNREPADVSMWDTRFYDEAWYINGDVKTANQSFLNSLKNKEGYSELVYKTRIYQADIEKWTDKIYVIMSEDPIEIRFDAGGNVYADVTNGYQLGIGSKCELYGGADCSTKFWVTEDTPTLSNFSQSIAFAPGTDKVTSGEYWVVESKNLAPISYPDGEYGENIPGEREPTPDLTNSISMHYEVKNKTIRIWNTTLIPPLNLDTMTCAWNVSNEVDGVVLDITSPCNEMQTAVVETLSYRDEQENFAVKNLTQIKMNILYDINGDGVVLDNESIGSITKPLVVDGLNYEGNAGSNWSNDTRLNWYECINGNAPFIHVPACLANIGVITNLLSFGAIHFGDSTAGDGCRTLGTVGDWIGSDSKVVCPAIPGEVRNIVTPFITFALGLVIVKYVAKKASNDVW